MTDIEELKKRAQDALRTSTSKERFFDLGYILGAIEQECLDIEKVHTWLLLHKGKVLDETFINAFTKAMKED